MSYRDLMRKIPPFNLVGKFVDGVYDELDYIKSRSDVPDALFNEFQEKRASDEYLAAFSKKNPLVSVCVSTYNRAELLVNRNLKSLLAQDYKNIEIIVVGDGCTDQTEEMVGAIKDTRIVFKNLSQRGAYPQDPNWRWMVAGTTAINEALNLARGDFVTHLDDDDEHSDSRISDLLSFIQCRRCDIVWHPFYRELPSGKWDLRRAAAFTRNSITTSSVFYHGWFKKILWDMDAYKLREPGDWNRFRKFKYIGAKAEFFPKPLLRHYREKSQSSALKG